MPRRRVYTAGCFQRQPMIRRRAAWLEANGFLAHPAWLSEAAAEDGDPATCATRDLADIRRASILIAFTEGKDSDIPAGALARGGRMVELGYALARGAGARVDNEDGPRHRRTLDRDTGGLSALGGAALECVNEVVMSTKFERKEPESSLAWCAFPVTERKSTKWRQTLQAGLSP